MSDLKLEGVMRFFAYARARYAVHVHRVVQGKPWPWTADQILQEYRFCNVFRELDKTTIWFRQNIREPLKDAPVYLQVRAAVAFRWFNRVETFQTLLKGWEGAGARELIEGWNADSVATVLRQDGKAPWVTGSYIIKTPDGMDKLTGVLWCIEKFIENHESVVAEYIIQKPNAMLEDTWEHLRRAPFLGDFMAYEVVTDLRHSVLPRAPDIMTWANPGPGACRGMSRVMLRDKDYFNRASAVDRDQVIAGMQRLLEYANTNTALWPSGWGKWEMREVEHTLCEFDKYERVRLGEGKPRQKFRR